MQVSQASIVKLYSVRDVRMRYVKNLAHEHERYK